MKTAKKVSQILLMLGAATFLFFVGPQISKSIATSAVTGPAPEVERGEVATHGGYMCETADCKFLNVSGGGAFRSVVEQDCPFCRTTLVKQ